MPERFALIYYEERKLRVRRRRPVTLKSVLPCRTTIANHTTLKANARLAKAQQSLLPFKEHSGAISLDYGRRVDDYLVVMCHFIDVSGNGWKLCTLPIGFEKSNAESKTAEQVWLELCDAVEVVAFTANELSGTFCVTDEGANVLSMSKQHCKCTFCTS